MKFQLLDLKSNNWKEALKTSFLVKELKNEYAKIDYLNEALYNAEK